MYIIFTINTIMKEYTISLTANRKSKDGSIMGKISDFREEMIKHEISSYNIYKKNPFITACDRQVKYFDRHELKEKVAIMFGSNSYLGLCNSPYVINKSIECIKRLGVGSGGVPLLTGTTIVQNELENSISKLTGFEDSILFTSGYCANLGMVSGLLGPENLIVHDKLNHASLIDGTVLSGAKMLRFKHNDLNHLERILKENITKYPGGILVVTDGVFSMDGDIANIPAILDIVRKYECLLAIDEAHATGVIGKNGDGTLSHFNIGYSKNIILTGCLSKALGVVGGYISASQEIIDYLRVYSRSNMFSTSLPPGDCASVLASLELMGSTDIVKRLVYNSNYLREKLKNNGFNTLNSKTAIIPVIIGDDLKASLISKEALESGIIVNPIFTPAVPSNLSRLRISVMASHTKEDMDLLVSILIDLFNKYGIQRF